MKKVLFTVALMFGAMSASAQLSVVKEAKSKKGNPAEAAQIIEAALTNPETANDPETWKLAGDFQKAIYDAENEKLYLSQIDKSKVADMPTMYNSLLKMFEYYMKCDELEQAKVASGALKKAKLRKKNADALLQVRPNLTNAGIESFNNNDYPTAQKFFAMYVDVVENPMFADKAQELKADTMTSLFANYAAMAAFMKEPKEVEAVIKYSTMGKENKSEGWRGLSYLAEVYGNKETGDSIKYLETIKEGVERFPEQEYFVQQTANYYIEKGKTEEGLEIINKVLTVLEKPYYTYLKGVFEYEKKDYNAANATFDKLIAAGGDFAAEAYAMKGNIYFYPTLKIVEENSTLAMEDPKYSANETKIKEAYQLAQPFYEKAKELKPDGKNIWGQQLLSIYWALNKAEYEALEKELAY